eukprot:Lithocolla_globosa_v1_NODE_7319_length_963_cov_8.747797.p2 type:complete len:128 gc:universal NODE_7319_length_963_cov_8.747797:563-946(+)
MQRCPVAFVANVIIGPCLNQQFYHGKILLCHTDVQQMHARCRLQIRIQPFFEQVRNLVEVGIGHSLKQTPFLVEEDLWVSFAISIFWCFHRVPLFPLFQGQPTSGGAVDVTSEMRHLLALNSQYLTR